MRDLDAASVAEKRALVERKKKEFRELYAAYHFEKNGATGFFCSGQNGAAKLSYDIGHDWWLFEVRYEEPKDHRAKLYIPHGCVSRVLMAALRELHAVVPTVTCEGCGLTVADKLGFPFVTMMEAGWSISADFAPGHISNVTGRCPRCR